MEIYEFVSLSLAKKLKKKGFDKECFAHYDDLGNLLLDKDYWKLDSHILAPTISQVLNWLREEKKMHIEIFLYNGKYGYFVNSVTQICEDDLFHKILNEDTVNAEYTTYEQAALAGANYCLENLI